MAFDTKPNLSNEKFEQFANETLTLSGRTEVHGIIEIENGGVLRLDDGNQQSGYVLTSDTSGITSWAAQNVTGATNGINLTNNTIQLGGDLSNGITTIGGYNVDKPTLEIVTSGSCQGGFPPFLIYNSCATAKESFGYSSAVSGAFGSIFHGKYSRYYSNEFSDNFGDTGNTISCNRIFNNSNQSYTLIDSCTVNNAGTNTYQASNKINGCYITNRIACIGNSCSIINQNFTNVTLQTNSGGTTSRHIVNSCGFELIRFENSTCFQTIRTHAMGCATDVVTGIQVSDRYDSLGLNYEQDYSSTGTTNPRWIPDWAAVTGFTANVASPASPDMAIQFNDGGSFGGTSNFIWDDFDRELDVYGTIAISGTTFISAGDGLTNVFIGNGATGTGNFEVSLGNGATSYGGSSISIGRDSVACSLTTIAIGCAAIANGNRTISIGRDATTDGGYGVSIGNNSSAIQSSVSVGSGAQSCRGVAVGPAARACSTFGIAIGYSVENNTSYSVAIGRGVVISGSSSVVVGSNSCAIGGFSNAIGFGARTYNNLGIAIGRGSINNGNSSLAIGAYSEIASNCSLAIGHNSYSSGAGSVSVGVNSASYGQTSVSIGANTDSCALNGISIGSLAQAIGTSAISIGSNSIGNSSNSIAIGNLSNSSGTSAIAIGKSTIAHDNAVSVGVDSRANSSGTAVGINACACGVSSTSIGETTKAIGNSSIVLGGDSCAVSNCSMTVGFQSCANAVNSFVFGRLSETIGASSVAIGLLNTACGNNSIVIGNGNVAEVLSIGIGDFTRATGSTSIAIGRCPLSSDINSIAIGNLVCSTAIGSIGMGFSVTNNTECSVAFGWGGLPSVLFAKDDSSYINGTDNTKLGLNTITPTARLHIDALGATPGFRLVDGNQQTGYVLTSDSDGNATWQQSTGGGGLDAKDAVVVATTPSDGNIDLTGGTFVTGSTIDGVVVQDGWRVLIKNQTDAVENGIYDYSASTSSFVRSSDFDGAPVGEVSNGAFTTVISGNTQFNSQWIVTTNDPITIGSSDINWSLLSQQLGIVGNSGVTVTQVGGNQEISVDLASNSGLGFEGGKLKVVDVQNIGRTISQTSHGFVVGDILAFSGGTYIKAIADGTMDAETFGIVSSVPDLNTFVLTFAGYVTGLPGLVANTTYWVSDVTAGELVSDDISTVGHISKPILVTTSATEALVLHYRGSFVESGITAISGSQNVGVGLGIATGVTGTDLLFKSISGGTNVSLVDDGGTITINGSGESNTGINLGGGEQIFAGKTSETLQFKSLVGVGEVDITSTGSEITISGLTTSPAGSDAEVQFNNNGSFGSSSGFTYNEATNSIKFGYGLTQGNNGVLLSNNVNAGTIGINTIAMGIAQACGNQSIAMGYSNTNTKGNHSIAVGFGAQTNGCSSLAIGSSVCTIGPNSVVVGSASCAHNASGAIGYRTCALAMRSFSVGQYTVAACNGSFAGGAGSSGLLNNIVSSGCSSFAFGGKSTCVFSDCSAILGGECNVVETGNSYSAIVGGYGITLAEDNYPNYTAVENFAIFGTPETGSGIDDVLVWDSTDKKVKKVTQSSGGGSSTLTGQTIVGNNTSTSFTINHGCGTRDLMIQIYENQGSYANVIVDVERPNTSCIRVNFDSAPAIGEDYRVLILD